MIKISLGLLIVALSTSCVSKKIYNDLENRYTDLKKENRSLADEYSDLYKQRINGTRPRCIKIRFEQSNVQLATNGFADYGALLTCLML
jgi:chemotaxis protein MotB